MELESGTYKRQTDEHSQKALNKISSALRHTAEDDIRIELKGGGVITGPEMRIKDYKSFNSVNGNLDVSDVFSQMRNWLEELLEKRIIEA